MDLKIAVISCWWNEEKLAKLFLKSHSYADQIFIFSDVEATDRSREIAKAWPKTEVIPIMMPFGFDDEIKIRAINDKARSLVGKFDWVVAVDSDEFVTGVVRCNLPTNPSIDTVMLSMSTVYRHHSESDFDPEEGTGQRKYRYGVDNKPCIVRPRKDLQWDVGCHRILSSWNMCKNPPIVGEHWGMADPEIAIERRLARRSRMSKNNLQKKWGVHCFGATEENIRAECAARSNGEMIPGK